MSSKSSIISAIIKMTKDKPNIKNKCILIEIIREAFFLWGK